MRQRFPGEVIASIAHCIFVALSITVAAAAPPELSNPTVSRRTWPALVAFYFVPRTRQGQIIALLAIGWLFTGDAVCQNLVVVRVAAADPDRREKLSSGALRDTCGALAIHGCAAVFCLVKAKRTPDCAGKTFVILCGIAGRRQVEIRKARVARVANIDRRRGQDSVPRTGLAIGSRGAGNTPVCSWISDKAWITVPT